MPKIKAVLCDGGSILFSDIATKNKPYEIIKQFMPISKEDFLQGYKKYKTKAQTEPNYSNSDALKDYLTEKEHAEIFDMIKKSGKIKEINKTGRLKLLEGVKEALQQIHEKNILFIILTDATKTGKQLQPKLEQMGIAEYVTDIISSKDVGVKKPHEKFFNKALIRHGLRKDEVIFVAHDLDELKGAHDLGFEVFAVNYDEKEDLSFLPEKNKLKDFSELKKILD